MQERLFQPSILSTSSPFVLSQKPIAFTSNSLVVIKEGNSFLKKTNRPNIFFPAEKLDLTEADKEHAIFIGELYGKNIFAVEKKDVSIKNAEYIEFHSILDLLNPHELKAFYRTNQLLNWHKQSHFCGHCGSCTVMADNEFAKICLSNSSHRLYPQYSPSMIVLVRHENTLLLGRSPHFAPGMYSTLAGFVEAGETVEEAVKREVMEEVGIEVSDIRPISSAPWPFPNSLMLAYEATPKNLELKIDYNELEDAQWFEYDKLPILPPKATISWTLIDYGIKQCEQFVASQTHSIGDYLGQ